jgi:L-iditol 2-dehydrogenase
MRAARLMDQHEIVISEIDDLRTGPGDILIRTKYAGVCGSDVHAFEGIHPFRKPPVVLGHELVGTIVDMGKDVNGFHMGDRVTVMPLIACGNCIYCRRGRQNMCLNKKVPGSEGWEGSFAEYFLSKPDITYRLRENTSFETGALAEPLAVGIHAVNQGSVNAESRVLVLGGGTVGLLTAVAARVAGARELVITDLYDLNLGVARDLCAATPYNAKDESLKDRILTEYPDKFDVVFLCSGAAKTVKQAMGLTQRGGRIVLVGMFLQPVPLEIIEVTLNELEMIGSMIYSQEDFRKTIELLDSGRFRFDRLITHILPIEKAQHALELLAQHKEDVIKILLDLGG